MQRQVFRALRWQISADVSMTEYEDGTKVYVNYGTVEAKTGSVNIPARDYLVVRGNGK